MSKFIETKLNCKFEDRNAFYEAENEEDLLYYKKILRPKKEEVNSDEVGHLFQLECICQQLLSRAVDKILSLGVLLYLLYKQLLGV